MAVADDCQILSQDKESVDASIARNKREDWPDLTPEKRAFALVYVVNYSHRDAAISVGLPANRGINLIRDPLVAAFIKDIQDKDLIPNLITEDFVRTHMVNLLPKLLGEEEVSLIDKEGEEFSAKKFHAADAVSLLKELAKSTKFYEDGSGGGGGNNVNVNIDLSALLGEDYVPPEYGITIEHDPDSE